MHPLSGQGPQSIHGSGIIQCVQLLWIVISLSPRSCTLESLRIIFPEACVVPWCLGCPADCCGNVHFIDYTVLFLRKEYMKNGPACQEDFVRKSAPL